MRPVKKYCPPEVEKFYKPPGKAYPKLEENLGMYCSYCEVFSSELEVEHIIAQTDPQTRLDPQLKFKWDNFLLSCGRCNGADNKGNKPVDLATMYFPHTHNTFFAFVYGERGHIQVNPKLTGNSVIHAKNTLTLLGLDKLSSNPRDKRLHLRRTAWGWARKHLLDYEANKLSAQTIIDFALQRGFFSIWYSVFDAHIEIKELLINNFPGTDKNCFDSKNGYKPIPRNPSTQKTQSKEKQQV